MNRLNENNCNKSKCKTCIFHEDQQVITPARLNEIKCNLTMLSATHVCHHTEKSCYGGLEFQAKMLFAIGFIPEPTVESYLKTASEVLSLPFLTT